METFSGYHMKICFINHCSPVKQKKNLITDEAIRLASFLCMETMKQGVFPPSETKRHIHTGASTRTGRSLRGNVLLRQLGQGQHTPCLQGSFLSPVHFQCRLESTEAEPSPLQEPLVWDEPTCSAASWSVWRLPASCSRRKDAALLSVLTLKPLL